ncbi:hypothetical protein [Glycomyces buryatensis]|uniref:Uncharacterized protein n=1 Tax=Glycomyces buryatensis TaxID=2570927 RepID=A0A4S8Q920_9ACTN|nr:hypothetical protein [Glycomyces buryatensis]THV40808.1 hypothetical protein FAB82_14260 [Glycomyces buryatensis]
MSNTVEPQLEPGANSRSKSQAKLRTALLGGTALIASAAVAVLSVQGAHAEANNDESEAAQATCVLAELPMPEDRYFSIVTGMSEDGSVIAYRTYDLDTYQRDTWLYSGGEATEVAMPGEDQSLQDVTTAGIAVGSTFEDGGSKPYIWDGTELTPLTTTAEYGSADGINEAGDIIGTDGEAESATPVLWPAGETEPVALELPEDATWGQATDIDEDGTIVGYYGYGEDNSRPYVWHPDGTGEALPLPDGVDENAAGSYPMDISGDWVSGYLFNDELETGMRWNLTEGTAEILDLVFAPGINPEGTAAGEASPSAAYQTADELVELPGLTDPADNYFGDTATEINEDGTLLAGQVYAGEDADGMHILKAVTWTCE